MFRTAVRVTSDVQERIDAVNVAHRIGTSTGYIADVPRRPGLIAQRDYATVDDSEKINFCLPFVTDDLSKAIRTSLIRSGLDDQVIVVEVPPTNLKKKLEVGTESARTVSEAIQILGGSNEEIDKHPEKRMRAAYLAFEEAMLPKMKQEHPTYRLSQLKQLLKKEWQKSPENPLNAKLMALSAK